MAGNNRVDTAITRVTVGGFEVGRFAIARKTGDRRGEALGSWNLGEVYEKEGELQKAIDLMQVRVNFEVEIGHPAAEEHGAYVEELRKKLNDSR